MIILIVAQFCRPFIKYGGVTERNVKDRIILGNFVPSNVSVVMLKFQENKASGIVRGDSILSNVTLLKCRSCRSIAEMFRTAISFFRNSNVGGRERENLKKIEEKGGGDIAGGASNRWSGVYFSFSIYQRLPLSNFIQELIYIYIYFFRSSKGCSSIFN